MSKQGLLASFSKFFNSNTNAIKFSTVEVDGVTFEYEKLEEKSILYAILEDGSKVEAANVIVEIEGNMVETNELGEMIAIVPADGGQEDNQETNQEDNQEDNQDNGEVEAKLEEANKLIEDLKKEIEDLKAKLGEAETTNVELKKDITLSKTNVMKFKANVKAQPQVDLTKMNAKQRLTYQLLNK